MSQVNAKVSSFRVYRKDGNLFVRVEFDNVTIPCFRYGETGELEESKSNALYLSLNVFIAMICDCNKELKEWFRERKSLSYSGNESVNPYDPITMDDLFRKIVLTIESTKHTKGEEYVTRDGETYYYQGDCFSHKIIEANPTIETDLLLYAVEEKEKERLSKRENRRAKYQGIDVSSILD